MRQNVLYYGKRIPSFLRTSKKQYKTKCRTVWEEERMSRYDEQKANTRARIRAAFWQLYTQKEIGRITVNEVIAGCGVNRSTFYRHYADVYQILEEIEAALLQKTERLSTSGAVSYNDMDVFLQSAYALYQEDREQLHYLVREQRDTRFADRYSRAIQQKLPVVYMRDGSHVTDKDLEATMELINFGTVDLFLRWADDDRLSFEKLRELFHGVSAEGIYPTLLRVYHIKPIFPAERQEL